MDTAVDRPQDVYKRDLLDLVIGWSPQSLLDIGCGEGRLLRSVASPGRRCVGIEVSTELVERLALVGLEARVGHAEHLEFEDRSFDLVVFEYTAHHLTNLDRAFLEAARVARRAVVVLDPWFDLSLPSQRVAYDFDLWLKLIDRRLGMVHQPILSAERLVRSFLALDDFQIDCRYRLLSREIPVEALLVMAGKQLDRASNPPDLSAKLYSIIDRARLHGVSEDGAILLCAARLSNAVAVQPS
jgi:SAM-dependent methyltransferase